MTDLKDIKHKRSVKYLIKDGPKVMQIVEVTQHVDWHGKIKGFSPICKLALNYYECKEVVSFS